MVSFLSENSAPCEKLVCTTCGGQLFFLQRLKKLFPNDADLAENLMMLKAADIKHMSLDQNCMPPVLNSLPEEIQNTVVQTWVNNAADDPDFALNVLLWTEFGKRLSRNSIQVLLATAEPRIAVSRKLRDNLRESLPPETEYPNCIQLIVEQDAREEEEIRRLAITAAKERNEYHDGISKISFSERVSQILNDSSIGYRDWRQDWSLCTDDDFETLDASKVQELIDLCESNQSYRWTEALRKLYDKRHQLRLDQMERIRRKNRHLDPHEQLIVLISDSRIPIEHYPVELAQFVTQQWLNTLTKEDRSYLLNLLKHTRLRVWKKVYDIT